MDSRHFAELSMYTGIFELKDMLDRANIENYLALDYDADFMKASKYQITVPITEKFYVSVIQGPCSAGAPLITNYLEVAIVYYPNDVKDPQVLSAINTFKFIKKLKRGGKRHDSHRQKKSSNMDNRHTIQKD